MSSLLIERGRAFASVFVYILLWGSGSAVDTVCFWLDWCWSERERCIFPFGGILSESGKEMGARDYCWCCEGVVRWFSRLVSILNFQKFRKKKRIFFFF